MAGDQHGDRRPARSRGERARLVGGGVLVALVAAFAVLNVGKVEVDWIVGTAHTPLIVVICASLLLGAALGYAVARSRARR